MAHGAQCIGTWINSKFGTTPDGSITIDPHVSNTITGTYVDVNGLNPLPIKGTCNGQKQDFKRPKSSGSTKKIHYKSGVITSTPQKFKIKGKFAEEAANASKSKTKKTTKAAAPDDWTAEKPT